MYTPKPPPPVPNELQPFADWLMQELQALAREGVETTEVELRPRAAEPENPREGMIVYADGTNWDPGSGAGSYQYVGGAWVLQRSGAEPNTYGTITDGTTPAPADVSGDTFKLRASDGVSVVTQNDDATHGDNALWRLNIAGMTSAGIALADILAFADVSNSNNPRCDTVQHVFDLINALTVKGSPADADLVAIYDVAGSAAKAATRGSIKGSKVLISTTSLVGVTGQTISVPSGYSDFSIVFTNCKSNSGLGQQYIIQVSEDGGSTFLTNDWIREGSSSGSNNYVELHNNMNNAITFDGIFSVYGYTQGHRRPANGFVFGSGGSSFHNLEAMCGFSSAAINAIRMQSTQNWATGSIDLWGTP